MKNYFLLFAASAASLSLFLSACTDTDDDGHKPVIDPVSNFTEVVTDFEDAVLTDVTYEGFNPTVYHNILDGKHLAALCEDEDSYFWDTMFYEGLLYTSGGTGICTMYNDGEWMGYGTYDTWSGFVLSSNCDAESMTVENQFSVWKADNGDNIFAVGYDSPSGGMVLGLDYDTPTILLDNACVVKSIDFMNTTYTAETIKFYDKNVTYVLKVTGYLEGEATGSVNITLAEGGNIVSDWLTVDTSSLGSVDKVTIQADMDKCASEVQRPEQWLPLFFCVDNIVTLLPKE